MPVRAKFKLQKIESQHTTIKLPDGTYGPGELKTLVLSPTYSDDPNSENKKFWDASPGGELKMNCVNGEAVAYFELGKEYYLDFTVVENVDTAKA